MDITVLDENPIYAGETYRLQFKFGNGYPIGQQWNLISLKILLYITSGFFLISIPFAECRPMLCSVLLTCDPEPPEVTFTPLTTPPRPIPLHPHIYSNGIICLDLLARAGWTPVHNVESVCMSIQSMLTGNTKSERPPGDEEFVRRNTLRPRDISWVFHDDGV